MNRSFRPYLCIFALLGPLTLSSRAVAQDVAAADALFNRGVTEMKAGRVEQGCPLIAESLRLDPQPGTLFTLSQCELKWGRVATAVARLNDYLQLYERLTPDQKAQQLNRPKLVKEQRDKFAFDVPELTLSLPPGTPEGTVVKRDNAVVASATLGIGLPIDPGEHVVSLQAPGGPLREQRITITKGEKRTLLLEEKVTPTIEKRVVADAPVLAKTPSPAKPAALTPIKAGLDGQSKAVYASGIGVSAIGLLGGIIFSAAASSASSSVNTSAAKINAERDRIKNSTDPRVLALNPGNRTNVCGDRDTGAGAVAHFADACSKLRSNDSTFHTDVALAVTSWVLLGVGVVGTTTYRIFARHPNKGLPQKPTVGPTSLAIIPTVSPSVKGVAIGGTF